MNVLVTGCAGFIASKVTETLLSRGDTVVGLDNLNDAYDVRLKDWRINQLQAQTGFTWSSIDVTDRDGLRDVFEQHGPFDAVAHLAARAGVRPSLDDPWIYYETNVLGTLGVLELCREFGTKKFLLASTSSVYGEGERPFRESSAADRPVSPYAASKSAAESLCYTYHTAHDIDTSVMRFFTVYGPAGRPDMAPFRFIKWIAEGEPLVLYGDGEQERDFTYVDDIAAGVVAALEPVGFEVFNLGNDRPCTVNHMIGIIEKLVGREAQVKREPRHPADVQATWADISKARDLLHWSPKTNFEQGLEKAVNWYMENREWAKEIATG